MTLLETKYIVCKIVNKWLLNIKIRAYRVPTKTHSSGMSETAAGGMALRKLGGEDRYLGKTEIALGRTCVTLVLFKIVCKCRGSGLMSPVSIQLDCHHLNIGIYTARLPSFKHWDVVITFAVEVRFQIRD